MDQPPNCNFFDRQNLFQSAKNRWWIRLLSKKEARKGRRPRGEEERDDDNDEMNDTLWLYVSPSTFCCFQRSSNIPRKKDARLASLPAPLLCLLFFSSSRWQNNKAPLLSSSSDIIPSFSSFHSPRFPKARGGGREGEKRDRFKLLLLRVHIFESEIQPPEKNEVDLGMCALYSLSSAAAV